MVVSAEERQFRQRMERIETLIQELEQLPDSRARAHAQEVIQAILDLQGTALERMLEGIAETGEIGLATIDALARDDLVGSLLLLHGLHPLDLETRVRLALDKVRPYLRSHGGDVKLLDVAGSAVRLRMQGSCHGCPSSAMTLKLAIEEAIQEKAPDVTSIQVEGVVQPPARPSATFIPSDQLLGNTGRAPSRSGGWEEVEGVKALSEGSILKKEVSGRPVLFCRLGGSLYAFENTCPSCGLTLDDARLETTALRCAGCGQGYDLVRAGRGLDNPNLHLEPFPLLCEDDRARIALPVLQG